jgi:hypothetical protein
MLDRRYASACVTPKFVQAMNERNDMTTLTPKLQTIVDRISALRSLTKTSGFRTEKSQRDLLMPLSPDDLALVAQALVEK